MTDWKQKYFAIEEMLLREWQWSYGEEWAKQIIRESVKEALKNKQKTGKEIR